MRRLGQVLAVLVVLVVSAGLIHAAATAQKCAGSKIKAASKKVSAKLKCYAKAVSKGEAVDGTCLSKADDKFNTAMGKADDKGGCAFENDANTLERVVDNAVNAVNAFEPNSPGHCCTAGSCIYVAEPNDCVDLGATLGASGTVCDAATGGCVAPPASPGHCCTLDPNAFTVACIGGPIIDATACDGVGGVFDPNGLCPPDGGGCVHFGNLP